MSEMLDTLPAGAVVIPAGEPILRITRSFAAPRALVWRCYTDPVHLVHFWAPKGATVPLSQLDLRVGGTWRQVMRFASGNEYGYTSVYLEIVEPERLVWRDAPDDAEFGDTLPPVKIHTTLLLTEAGSRTDIEVVVRFNSIADRDDNARRGFAETVAQGNDKLAGYLATLIAGQQET